MKKVLIIARYFGTRVPGLLKYLMEFGYLPILLTTVSGQDKPLPPDIKFIQTDFGKGLLGLGSSADLRGRVKQRLGATSRKSFIDSLLTLGGEIFNYPDSYKGWKSLALKAANELLQNEKIDVIISSSSPVTGHIIANELKAKYHLPWVADLRDLWSQNHNYAYSRFRKWFDRRLELKTLSAADALVTVSQPWAEKLGSLHQGKTVYTITNGFDPDVASLPPASLTPKFTITHTGNIYAGKQDPTRILDTIHSLASAGTIDLEDIEVRFYGPKLEWLEKEISKYGLSAVIHQHGTVPHEIALEKQRESQLLLLLDWDDPEEMGVYPLKAFEYLGASRPVLATGGTAGNVIDRLLDHTRGGTHAITPDEVAGALREFYQQYKRKGQIPYRGVKKEINLYSQREMARQFANILDRLTPIQ